MTNIDGTDRYSSKAKGMDWLSLAIWAAGVGIAIGGWAHTTLWSHDNRITTLEVERRNASADFMQHQERDAKIQDQIHSTLRRLEDKIDALKDRGKY